MGHVTGFARFVGAVGVRLLGIAAAMLPKRWWPWLDERVPASASTGMASAATLLLAGAIGIPGFLDYAGYTASAHNLAAIQGAERHAELDTEGALRRVPMAFNALALPMFLALTPLGWLTTYLAVSGLLRSIAAVTGDSFGDPLMTGIDAAVVRSTRRARDERERLRRTALEGREMPDRLVGAAQLGIAGAEFVLVASRRKPDWDAGTVVITPDGTAYRVGRIEDRTIAGQLRTLYTLTEHKDLEAFRRVVHYELPPGRRT